MDNAVNTEKNAGRDIESLQMLCVVVATLIFGILLCFVLPFDAGLNIIISILVSPAIAIGIISIVKYTKINKTVSVYKSIICLSALLLSIPLILTVILSCVKSSYLMLLPKDGKISVKIICNVSKTNHASIGNEWGYSHYVNGHSFESGEVFIIKANEITRISSRAVEYDDSEDDIGGSESSFIYLRKSNDFKNNVVIHNIFNVKETGGKRYADAYASCDFKYTIYRVVPENMSSYDMMLSVGNRTLLITVSILIGMGILVIIVFAALVIRSIEYKKGKLPRVKKEKKDKKTSQSKERQNKNHTKMKIIEVVPIKKSTPNNKHKKKSQSANAKSQDKDIITVKRDDVSTGEIEKICIMLAKKGFSHLLMKDFEFQTKLISWDMEYDRTVDEKLNMIKNEVMSFLQLPNTVNFEIRNEDTKKVIHHVNKVTSTSPLISIEINSNFSVSNVVALICRECTKHFIYHHSIIISKSKEIDIIAGLIGFSRIIREGYQDIVQNSGQIKQIGRIDTRSCERIQLYLKKARKALREEQEADHSLDKEKNELLELITFAEQLKHQIDEEKLQYSMSINMMDEDKYQKIKEVIDEYDSSDVLCIIEECRVATLGNSAKRISKAKSAMGDLLTNLHRWRRMLNN